MSTTRPLVPGTRAAVLLALALIASVSLAVSLPQRADAATDQYPVILVHGLYTPGTGEPAATASRFNALASELTAAGHRAYVVQLPGNKNRDNARTIANAVLRAFQETGQTKVHLVSHSMGALSTRYFIKVLDGGTHVGQVASYVAMGPAHKGLASACFVSQPWQGSEMCAPGQGFGDSSLITELNRNDDTAGSFLYTSLRGKDDQTGPSHLDGGALPSGASQTCWVNMQSVTSVSHANEPTDTAFKNAVKTAITGVCPTPGVLEKLTVNPTN
jgi:triacylglycerol lipase